MHTKSSTTPPTHACLLLLLTSLLLALGACQSDGSSNGEDASKDRPAAQEPGANNEEEPSTQPAHNQAAATKAEGQPLASAPPEGMAVATFAGGCFWCVEKPFDKLDGVQDALSGYTDGQDKAPTYKKVSSGSTGHTEAVRVIYDPTKITYQKLLDAYWRSFDPTDASGQFADRGSQYRPALYYHNDEQKKLAEASKKALAESKRFKAPIVVPIKAAQPFYLAEDYHQNYWKKNSTHYERYYEGSGRGPFLRKTWGSQ